MIADPPSDAGSAHARATDCEAEVVVSDSGTEGTVAGAATNDAEYAALPAGAVFVGPDGKQRRKP